MAATGRALRLGPTRRANAERPPKSAETEPGRANAGQIPGKTRVTKKGEANARRPRANAEQTQGKHAANSVDQNRSLQIFVHTQNLPETELGWANAGKPRTIPGRPRVTKSKPRANPEQTQNKLERPKFATNYGGRYRFAPRLLA